MPRLPTTGGACDTLCSNPTIMTGTGYSGNVPLAGGCWQFQGTIGSGGYWNMSGRTIKLNNVAQTGGNFADQTDRESATEKACL